MEKVDNAVWLARQAQAHLKTMIRFLETDLYEALPLSAWPQGFISTGSQSLDTALQIGGIPRGACVEIRSPIPEIALGFCLRWAAKIQASGYIVVLADPYGEIDRLDISRAGLHPRRTIVVEIRDPHKLAASLLRIIERAAAHLVVLPPGLVGQFGLGDRANRGLTPRDERGSFLRALAALSWAARRTGTTLAVVRRVSERMVAASFGWSQFGLRIDPGRALGSWCVLIEHNRFAPSSVGATATCRGYGLSSDGREYATPLRP